MSIILPSMLAAAPTWVIQHLPMLVFVFCFGACVGSFMNVVVYRLPAGMSVIRPPSRCPTCGARLKFFRENLPIIGWFAIRGRCRYCGERVSPRYMIIELGMALVFVALYAALFMPERGSTLAGLGGHWWLWNQFFRAWPAYFTVAFLLAGLYGMTVIDARTFTIPIEIPLFVTGTAFVLLPLQVFLDRGHPDELWLMPCAGWAPSLAAVGGMLGVIVGVLLLWTGTLRYSFADYDEYLEEGEVLADYPHARREMRRELVFLLPCLLGIVAGGFIGARFSGTPPHLVQAIGGMFLGYLSGGGLIWGIRILGTFLFGREAMGLGDVHLLAAIGAVLGWFDPILIFFIAPFSGLLWALGSMGLMKVFRLHKRELPYGPHLAVATLIVLLGRPWLMDLLEVIMPGVPLAKAGFVP